MTFNNIKTVDNGLAGIEIEKVVDVMDDVGRVQNSVVVGRSMTNGLGSGNPHGVIAPRTDKWTISNVRFHNYDWGTAAALGTCSHCYSEPSTDSDGRTVKTDSLAFTNVDKRIAYQFPYKGIILDTDGSLTGKGANSWASSLW